ncbi:hypothetical protein G9464_04155 [Halostella sp. JP-L12]|uniref:cupredoxin domain-containing protein n=1 Tax=Halostella TaxID=1843185 RepID=UPI000EF7723C|nr:MULTISPECIES: plastocyanin/azurin family copper-binding protein [Halostella]NHN46789.1 hypothetical protein [Halostella sp. JP-L12]
MSDRSPATRRRFLAASAAAVAIPTIAGAASATSGTDADAATASTQQETFRLESHVNGWEGVAPESIAGERNPTLRLTEGEEYEVVWENVDGVSHNFLVRTDGGERVAETETVGEEGETRSVTFTATADLSGYRCGLHPSTMDGDIAFGEAETTTETTEETTTETATETTATETTTAAPTTTTITTEDGGGDSDGGGQPGFGLLAAAAGLLGGLGLRCRRD